MPKTEESRLISTLRRLAKNWPKGYWLFANGVHLYLMRTHPDGTRHTPGERAGGMDPELIVETLTIPADGGDW